MHQQGEERQGEEHQGEEHQGEERRRVQRVAFGGPVIIRFRSPVKSRVIQQQIYGGARDLSSAGIGFRSRHTIESSESCVTRFIISEAGIMEIDGRVVYQIPVEDWNLVGVEFLDVSQRAARAIHTVVEGEFGPGPLSVLGQG